MSTKIILSVLLGIAVLTLLGTPADAFAIDYTNVAPGDWTNPNIWEHDDGMGNQIPGVLVTIENNSILTVCGLIIKALGGVFIEAGSTLLVVQP